MDCHGAGGDRSFNSLIPDALDARCEFVVQTRWTEYTAMLEAGLRRRAVRRPARDARAPSAACSRTPSARPAGTTLRFNGDAVGEVGINAALCGTWGCPVDARHRRRRRLRARRPRCSARACTRSRSRRGARALQRPPPLPRPRSRAARAGRPRRARRHRRAPRSTTPGRPARSTVELEHHRPRRPYRHRAGVTADGPAHDRGDGGHVVGRLARDLPLSAQQQKSHAVGDTPSRPRASARRVTGGRSRRRRDASPSVTSWLVSANVARRGAGLTAHAWRVVVAELEEQSVGGAGRAEPDALEHAAARGRQRRRSACRHRRGRRSTSQRVRRRQLASSRSCPSSPLQPGSGSVAPAASRESIMPSPSSSLPLLHFGAGGGSVAQLPTGSCSSATSPLRR